MQNLRIEDDPYNSLSIEELDAMNENNIATMLNSIELCSLYRTNSSGRQYKKYPKLVELHETLFNEIPNGLHNAMADVIVCLRCYYKMEFDADVFKCSADLAPLSKKYLSID